MKRVATLLSGFVLFIAVLAAMSALPEIASAEPQNAPEAIGDVFHFDSDGASRRTQTAIETEILNRGAYNAPVTNIDTMEVTSTTNQSGTFITAGSTNIVNSSTSSISSTVGAGSTGVIVSVDNGTNQGVSGPTTQGAQAQTTSTSGGGDSNLNASASTHP
jgi:ABC-type proline/glycine betaine transport system substrate-binding protein